MGQQLSIDKRSLDGFEGLHHAVQGTHVDVMQLGRGKLRGSLTHVELGDFSLSIGMFSVGIRTQRIATDDKLIIGMLLNSTDRVTHWSFDMRPADVLVMPPHVAHDGTFHGSAAYAAIRLDLANVASLFNGEPMLSDPANWVRKNHYRANSLVSVDAARKLPLIVSSLAEQKAGLSDAAADFWRRSIIDAMTATVVDSLPSDTRGPLPSALRLVRDVENHLATAGARPVHISEICAAFNVSRRTLHRAFYDVVGFGPVTFLRHKRLGAIYSALRHSDPAAVTVAEIALQQGFIELGRFSHYYHSLFGEYPSETLGSRHSGKTWRANPESHRKQFHAGSA
jgi:AraC-like DNA-binding protein